MPLPILRSTVTLVVLVLTLGSGGTLAIEEEPPAPGAFSPAGSLAEGRAGHTATLLPDGRVLVIGRLASAEAWDSINGTFGPAGTPNTRRANHTATLLPDGRVFVIGGPKDSAILRSAEVWDPTTSRFSPGASLAKPRQGYTATPLTDGRVLLVGGFVGRGDDWAFAALAEAWDPASPSRVPVVSADLPTVESNRGSRQ